MQNTFWVRELRQARRKPEFFVGPKQSAHLQPLTEVLRLLWETKAFGSPRQATFVYTPNEYLLCCETDAVHAEIEALLDCRNCDVLFAQMAQVGIELRQAALSRSEAWLRPFESATFGFGYFTAPLYLATRGFVALRTREGLWCQGYEEGWPTTAPSLLQGNRFVGLAVGMTLNRKWFPGLPFTDQEVVTAIPEAANGRVRLQARSSNDLLPNGLLSSQNIPEAWRSLRPIQGT
jgi:hypothetical protein